MTLDQIVREYLIEAAEPEHKYFRALQFGISGLRELHFDVTGIPVIKILDVNSDDTVDLPNDYLNYVRIGFTDGSGQFRDLGVNRDIALNRTLDDCGLPGNRIPEPAPDLNSMPYIGEADVYSSHFRNGQQVGRYYGAGGGNNANGYFKIDLINNQIQLSGYAGGGKITIEYLSDPTKADGEFTVHPFAVETLKCWISWKMSSNNKNIPLQDGMLKKNEYFRNIKILRARLRSLSVQDLLQSFRKGNKQSPKF